MWSTSDSEFWVSRLYYITLIILGTFFFVSVFVAAISGVFLRLRKEHQAVLLQTRKTRNIGASNNLLQRAIRRMTSLGRQVIYTP